MPRSTLIRICGLLALLVLVPGCRSAMPSSYALAGRETGPSIVRTSGDVLGYAEIQSAHVNDAQEAVMRFRPEFLRRRSEVAATDPNGGLPIVYVNGNREGGASVLQSIPATVVEEIRYLSPVSATHEFGTYYPGGVISVRTRR